MYATRSLIKTSLGTIILLAIAVCIVKIHAEAYVFLNTGGWQIGSNNCYLITNKRQDVVIESVHDLGLSFFPL